MSAVDQKALVAWRSFNGLAPMDLSKGVTIDLDFTAASGSNGLPIDINLEQVEDDGRLTIIQGIWIDNFDSGQAFTLVTQISGHRINVASGKQAMLPLFAPPKATFQAQIAAAATKNVRIMFLNFPVPAIVW